MCAAACCRPAYYTASKPLHKSCTALHKGIACCRPTQMMGPSMYSQCRLEPHTSRKKTLMMTLTVWSAWTMSRTQCSPPVVTACAAQLVHRMCSRRMAHVQCAVPTSIATMAHNNHWCSCTMMPAAAEQSQGSVHMGLVTDRPPAKTPAVSFTKHLAGG